MFWFRKINKQKRFSSPLIIFWVILMIIAVGFLWINTLFWFQKASMEEKASIAKNITWWIDSKISTLITKSNLLYQVLQSGWSLLDHQQDLQEIITLIKENPTIKKYLPKQYLWIYEFAQKRLVHSDILIDLLGPDRVRTYFVALMNTAEIRPNGGFFWSYAIIQLYKGKLVHYKVYDTYYAYHQNTWSKLFLTPEYQKILGQQTINIISPNLYGQTAIDAGNIKILYEQLFPGQLLDGVILLDTELISQLLPSIQPKLLERQFINASIDLIRWTVRGNKKEQYLAEIGSFIETHKDELINQIISSLPSILQSNHIQLYLPATSNSFQSFLETQWLSKKRKSNELTIHHINKSFNKIDTFVNKKYTLQDQQGKILLEWTQPTLALDMIQDTLKRGEVVDLYLFYTLSIPQSIIDQIFALTKQYEIELTPREQHILWLSYNRHNQLILTLPDSLVFESIDGSIFCKNQPTASGSLVSVVNTKPSSCYTLIDGKHYQTLSFDMMWFGNNVLKVVRVRFRYTGE